MPIKIPNHLPAAEILINENIFLMPEQRAVHQDIRPLKIVILNLMPTKIATETQLLRLIGNTPLQVEVVLLHPESHTSKNTSEEHLATFYQTFNEIKNQKFDGMIITGAPVEQLEFEEVTYWKELTQIMEWSLEHVYSTFHICWGAQAGLYYHYGVKKYPLPEKMFGLFAHRICKPHTMLLRGFDELYFAPHSRHTEIRHADLASISELEILSDSEIAGIYIIKSKGGRQIFVTGHSEYDPETLKNEYERDHAKGLAIKVPQNYFPNDDPTKPPQIAWRAHANLLFSNWLNYYVYQATPFDLNQITR